MLWLQYGRRRTLLARAIVAGACTALVPVLTPPPEMFGVLRLLTPATDVGRTAGAALAPGCFPHIATETESGDIPDEARRLWDADQRAKAGRRAIAFSTTVAPTGVPGGWKAMIGYAQAFFTDPSGRVLHRLEGANTVFGRPDGVNASVSATHFWLAPRGAYEDAERQSARLRLKCFRQPDRADSSTEIGVNGRRQCFGLRVCSAGLDASPEGVRIDCFMRNTSGAGRRAVVGRDSRARNHDAPQLHTGVEMLNGAPYRLTLPRVRGGTAARITLTACEARAHVELSVDAPGLRGGPSCSAPNTSTSNTHGEQP